MTTEISLKRFYLENDRETWSGHSTALKNGAKFRLLLLDPEEANYTYRTDFQGAWKRGYDAMDKHISEGGIITDLKISLRNRGQLKEYENPLAEFKTPIGADPRTDTTNKLENIWTSIDGTVYITCPDENHILIRNEETQMEVSFRPEFANPIARAVSSAAAKLKAYKANAVMNRLREMSNPDIDFLLRKVTGND